MPESHLERCDSVLKMMDFVRKMMEFVLQMMDSILKMLDLILILNVPASHLIKRRGNDGVGRMERHSAGLYSKHDEFVSKNDGFCIKNDELCITNDEFCVQMMNFVCAGKEKNAGCRSQGHRENQVEFDPKTLKLMEFALELMDFILEMMDSILQLMDSIL